MSDPVIDLQETVKKLLDKIEKLEDKIEKLEYVVLLLRSDFDHVLYR